MEKINTITVLRKEKPWLRSRDIEKKPGYFKRYKEKQCPTCGKLHRNLGKYCCRTCVKKPKISEETRLKKSRARLNYLNRTQEGLAHRTLVFNGRKHDDYLIDTPSLDLIDMIISQ
jgi:hypothetical protein